jgi:hypothetical protein
MGSQGWKDLKRERHGSACIENALTVFDLSLTSTAGAPLLD